MFRTAIEAEILFAACVVQRRFLGAVIKPVHPCTGLIACFAQQNVLLLRTTDVRVGTEKKTPREQNSSGQKIGAVWCSGADRRSFEASAVLHFVFFEVIVNKMQQSAKERCLLKRNTLPEVFPLTIGSGKTMPFEKRHVGCEEREKINRRRIYDTLRINFFEATKQTACIFSKGDGNMTRKASTTNLPGARGNAYPKAELDYDLTYEYDPAYAHRLVHAGNRYYRYDANGNITAEKDGPFTEDDEFVFTYNYDPDTDVYGTDYGFGLDAPKETEESHPENLFAYRRNYTWNEKNLLTKSSDRSYTVHYRYGEDGQRALKYTEEGRSETLYFNNFYTIHIPVQDKNNPQGLRVHKHIFVGNSRLVTAMTHTDNNGDNAEQREKRYYYHSDHLGSAQFVTDWRGKQYEHIEYTPYGELWIEEVAAGLDKLPFRFTGKEMDEETGLYYYGARYLDPKYSRWLSGDPALNDYIPKAPIDDEAKKHNENLPGMGGVYNIVNMHLYHYAGNNPVKYTDPDGKFSQSKEVNRIERNLSWNDFSTIRDGQKAKQDRRDTVHSFLGFAATAISTFFSGVIGNIANAASTADGLLSVKPDNLNQLNNALQNISNKAADISQTTGEVPNIEIVEITTKTAKNEDVRSINGAALVYALMEHSITEETTLEITINGEKQESITVSKKQTHITYERTLNYEDFSWVQ